MEYIVVFVLVVYLTTISVLAKEDELNYRIDSTIYEKTIRNKDHHEDKLDPEVYMNAAEIITYHGYPVEDHVVTTADGYMITVQRIPHGKKLYLGKKRNPILLLHGLLGVSTGWVLNIPKKNLAYKLAEEGREVWLGNIRGNSYGRRHVNLSDSQNDFWNFSFHEMGIYDMPAIIDYILSVSGSKQLDYIGHSLGSLIMMVALSSKPEYNDKVGIAQFFGPVAANRYMCNPLRYLAPVEPLLRILSHTEAAPIFPLLRYSNRYTCRTPEGVEMCLMSVFLTMGVGSRERLNATRMPVYASHTPDPTSFKVLAHILQMRNGKFHLFDYGKRENVKRYGQVEPPNYNLTKITTPIVLYWSDSDAISSPLDIAMLILQLPSVVLDYNIPDEKFNHIDYFHATDADRLVHDKVIEVLHNEKFTRKLSPKPIT